MKSVHGHNAQIYTPVDVVYDSIRVYLIRRLGPILRVALCRRRCLTIIVLDRGCGHVRTDRLSMSWSEHPDPATFVRVRQSEHKATRDIQVAHLAAGAVA